MTVINLPMPPSVNGLFLNRIGGRSITKRYADWRKEAGIALINQRPERVSGRVSITMAVQEPKRASDLDNRIKPVLDLLVEHRVIDNDDNRFVRCLQVLWDKSTDGVRVQIEPHMGDI